MKKAVSGKALEILKFLIDNQDRNMTAEDISKEMGGDDAGYGIRSVNASVTAGLQRKGYTERIPAEFTLPDGTHKPVKIIKLTEAGLNYDHKAAIAEDEATNGED